MPTPLESSVIRIYSNNSKVVGAGFLVSQKYILTCAHVVADALGIARNTAEMPNAEVRLDFPLLAAKQLFTARIVFWRPVNPNEFAEDIAALELESSPPNTAQPARLVASKELWGHPFRVLGFPKNQPNGVWAAGEIRAGLANGWVQLEDIKQQGYALEPGFSGAPIWDEQLQGVAGMAVAAEMERAAAKVAFIIPTQVLIAAWPDLDEQVPSIKTVQQQFQKNYFFSTNSLENPYVLLVDDDRDNLRLHETLVVQADSFEGYSIIKKADGMSALEQIIKRPPILLITDADMPGMDGYELIQQIRSNKQIPIFPILMVTAYQKYRADYALEIGAYDFIRKPFDGDEFIARVNLLLDLKNNIDERNHILRLQEIIIDMLTHEIRTPMVATRRMLTIFHEEEAFGKISSEMKQVIEVMIRSNENSFDLINTLIEFSRFENGKKIIKFELFNLQENVEEVVQKFRLKAEEKGLGLKIDISELNQYNNDYIVLGDQQELSRVFTTLVSNAIRVTDTGSVIVRLSVIPPSSTDEGWITVEVEATSTYLSEDDLPTLFELYRGKRRFYSSNLELYLSRRIVEYHNGKIGALCEPEKGTSFIVYLPSAQ